MLESQVVRGGGKEETWGMREGDSGQKAGREGEREWVSENRKGERKGGIGLVSG